MIYNIYIYIFTNDLVGWIFFIITMVVLLRGMFLSMMVVITSLLPSTIIMVTGNFHIQKDTKEEEEKKYEKCQTISRYHEWINNKNAGNLSYSNLGRDVKEEEDAAFHEQAFVLLDEREVIFTITPYLDFIEAIEEFCHDNQIIDYQCQQVYDETVRIASTIFASLGLRTEKLPSYINEDDDMNVHECIQYC